MWPLILRDIKLAIRSGGGFALTLSFFLIVVMIVPFGVGANLDLLFELLQEYFGSEHCYLAYYLLTEFSN